MASCSNEAIGKVLNRSNTDSATSVNFTVKKEPPETDKYNALCPTNAAKNPCSDADKNITAIKLVPIGLLKKETSDIEGLFTVTTESKAKSESKMASCSSEVLKNELSHSNTDSSKSFTFTIKKEPLVNDEWDPLSLSRAAGKPSTNAGEKTTAFEPVYVKNETSEIRVKIEPVDEDDSDTERYPVPTFDNICSLYPANVKIEVEIEPQSQGDKVEKTNSFNTEPGHSARGPGRPLSQRAETNRSMRNVVQYPCDRCSKRFSNKRYLIRHQETHTLNRLYICDVCKRHFINKRGMQTHVLKHFNDRCCGLCSMKFINRARLDRHMELHSVDRRYGCQVCSYRFACKKSLRRHMAIHSDKQNYKCEICQKRFTRKESLTSHMHVHSYEKPHGCDECGMRFSRRDKLMRHLMIHKDVEQKRYCEDCEKRFTLKSKTARRSAQRTCAERAYECDICRKQFIEK